MARGSLARVDEDKSDQTLVSFVKEGTLNSKIEHTNWINMISSGRRRGRNLFHIGAVESLVAYYYALKSLMAY